MNERSQSRSDYAVSDISLADWGEREIAIARTEMPGLMALQSQYRESRPLAGARISGCLHMTVQTAVLIETLLALGAEVRWASCNIYSTQDQAAAAMAVRGVPVFARKGETVGEYWSYVDRIFDWEGDAHASLILDDGGDALGYVLHGARAEADSGVLRNPASEEEEAFFAMIERRKESSPGWFSAAVSSLRGVSEETTTGALRLRKLAEGGALPVPAIDVNHSVTKSKFDNRYGCRESLVDALRRATDVMIAGKLAMVAGYGDVGKGSAASLRGAGARVVVSEIDPICALQAAMDGFEVVRIEDVVTRADIFVTATGNRDVVRLEHMRAMKHMAIVCNIGHFDNEIDVSALANLRWTEIKPQVDAIGFPDGREILLLSRGRLVNLGNATGHPSFVMSASFANQVMAQIALWRGDYAPGIHALDRETDEKVAFLHLEALGASLTSLTPVQAAYIGVDPGGPYKDSSYRY